MSTQSHGLTGKAILLATLIGLLTFSVVLAASGDLDTTFDGDGLVTTNMVPSDPARIDVATDIAIQANGKIVAAGYSLSEFALTRYNTDGSLDNSFSLDGRLLTNFGGRDEAYDVAVQSNGKIIVSGMVCDAPTTIGGCDAALARYNPGGGLDTTFSGDGKQTTDFGPSSFNGSQGGLVIQPNGKIVVAGFMSNGMNQDFAVYRYNADGSLDTTFSGDGMINISFGAGQQDFATDLVLQSDGKIVVGGYTGDVDGFNNNFAMARLNINGTLDTAFSSDGKQITNFGANDLLWAVTLQPNGKIVVVGDKVTSTSTPRHFAMARYNTNGSLDMTFNGTGKKVFRINPGADSFASDLIVQSDNKIIVLGTVNNGIHFDFALARLKPGGAFDTAFSSDGKVTIDFGGDDFGVALALQPMDGKYVMGGVTYEGGVHGDFALARVLR